MAIEIKPEQMLAVANTIRGLAMDGVQKAKSGHPGMPMAMADISAVLWLKHLKHCPTDPAWPDRDRFVLSAGHGSMLIYSLLHLAGYDLPIEELKNFRQIDSKTPGHPEHGETSGVETTTGPLGQGCGNAVGMALAERMLAARFNNDESLPVDHYTYVIASDGDMMEGLSHEALSLAGHLKLNKLIVFYDYNHITIEGSTDLAYSDNPAARFAGYNWNVLEIDAHDHDQIDDAIGKAKQETSRPTLIVSHSHIGYGSPNKADTHSAHGEPLGEEEVKASKRNLGIPGDDFHVPGEVRDLFAARLKELEAARDEWKSNWKSYCASNPKMASLWDSTMEDAIPENIEELLAEFPAGEDIATRASGGKVIQDVAAAVPWLVGGSADLAPSTKTLIKDAESVGPDSYAGRNLHFGIREHAMAAMMNGMTLHGGFRVFGATFFVFLDYCRPSVRLAAIMKLPVTYVFTHDSFYVGEDGPTHQPVEHLASLRCMPNVTVIRPCDANEVRAAWIVALRNKTGPTVIALTRQKLPTLDRTEHAPASMLEKGAYTIWQSGDGVPGLILIATGSEVHPALEAARKLGQEKNVRVVSMPSRELFELQSEDYRENVLPAACDARVIIEAGVSFGWEKYAGARGEMLTLDHFGASGPYKALADKFGFTADNVVRIAERLK